MSTFYTTNITAFYSTVFASFKTTIVSTFVSTFKATSFHSISSAIIAAVDTSDAQTYPFPDLKADHSGLPRE